MFWSENKKVAGLLRVQPREGLRKLGGVGMVGGQVPGCQIRETGGEGLPSGGPHWLNGPTLG